MNIQQLRLAKGTPFETPYYVIHGSHPGPVCMITAGIHGTEIAGMLAAKRMAKLSLQRGTVVLVPIVNIQAYKKRTRGFRGCRDLNRMFPRKKFDQPLHPLAKELFRLAELHQPDYCIDLHEANGFSKVNPKQLGQSLISSPQSFFIYGASVSITKEINQQIKFSKKHFTVKKHHLPGSFRSSVHLLGCQAITVETSMQLPLKERIDYQIQIVQRLLLKFRMLKSV